MPIQCEIVTQDSLLFEGPADIVIAPAADGEVGILPNHAPLLTTLNYGILRVRYQGEEEVFTIAGGVLEARPDVVIVLADVGERVAEIDLERAEAARERAEKLLERTPTMRTQEYMALELALRRSKLRLSAVKRYGRTRKPRRLPHQQQEE